MRHHFSCPQGHSWEAALPNGLASDPDQLICPVCGESSTSTLPSSRLLVPASSPSVDPVSASATPPLAQGGDTLCHGSEGDVASASFCVAGYEMLDELGRGSMGVVYRARDVRLNRIVALKMILAGRYAEPEVCRRFLAEAEAVARLQHPNVVQIFEVGEQEGRPFFALEFVDGGSLERKLAGKPLLPRVAAPLVEMLAEVMDVAHRHGIVHRDLKPANILLARSRADRAVAFGNDPGEGERYAPKVTDFGLAKRLDGEAGQTRSGVVMGTPSYMAPEQARGKTRHVGPAADIYALGAILYHLLTGRPPFQGADLMDTLDQVCTKEPVPPRQLQPKCPRDLETICLKCLHKEPARRYPSASALAEDLRRFRCHEPIQARPTGVWERLARWCRRQPAVAGLSAALLLAALGGFLLVSWKWREALHETERAEQATQEAVAMALRERDSREQAEEARRLAEKRQAEAQAARNEAETARGEANVKARLESIARRNEARARQRLEANLYIKQMEEARTVSDSNNRASLEQILDGAPPRLRGWEWYFLKRMSRTGALTLRGHTGDVSSVACSADGKWLASGSGDGTARLWETATGRERRTLRGHRSAVVSVSFSPDGRRLATSSGQMKDGQDATGEIKVWDTSNGQLLFTVTDPAQIVWGLAFSPDGRELAGYAGSILKWNQDGAVKVWDASNGHLVRTLQGTKGFVWRIAFHPTDPRLAAADAAGHVIVWDRRTGEERLRFSDPSKPAGASCYCLAFSPDGKRLAWGSNAVAIHDADTGKKLQRLDGEGQFLVSVVYRPDGKEVAAAGVDQIVKVWDSASGKQTRVLSGHTSIIWSLAYSPDGRRLVSGSADRTVNIWDNAAPSSPVRVLPHQGSITALAFSPDGRHLAVSDDKKWIKVWDARTGREEAVLKGHQANILSLVFHPDGRRLASAGGEANPALLTGFFQPTGELFLWDWAGGTKRTPLPGKHGLVLDLDFSPDGKRLAVAGMRDGVKIWDLAGGEVLFDTANKVQSVKCLAYSPDGRLLAFGIDNDIRVWDAATGRTLQTLRGHTMPLLYLAFSPDGVYLASSSVDRQLRLWDARDGRPLHVFRGHTSFAWSLAFSPDGRRLATACQDGTVGLWDTETGQLAYHFQPHSGKSVMGVAFSPDGQLLATGGADNTAKVWDVRGDQEAFTLRGHTGALSSVAFSPTGVYLLTAGADRTVKIWDAASGQEVHALNGHRTEVAAVVVSPDGRFFFSASGDSSKAGAPGEVRNWDASTGRSLWSRTVAAGAVRSLAVSPDGRRLALACEDGTVRLWETDKGHESAVLHGHTGAATRVAFRPDGVGLASAGEDHTIRLWDVASAHSPRTLDGHTGAVRDIAFSPDGKTLASASLDRTVKLWDVASGRVLRTFGDGGSEFFSVALDRDGRRLAAGTIGLVNVWEIEGGRQLFAFRGHSHAVTALAFSPDGRTLVSASRDQTAKAWRLAAAPAVLPQQGEAPPIKSLLAKAGQYQKAGQWLTAIPLLNRAIDANPLQGDLFVRRGRAYARLDRWNKALADFTRAVDLEADDWTVLRDRGEAHLHLQHWHAADDDLSRAIAARSTDAWLWHLRGYVRVQLGQWEQAFRDHSRSIELGTTHWKPWNDRGDIHAHFGRHELAVADFTRSIELAPQNVLPRYYRALAYMRLKRWNQARADFTELNKMEPDNHTMWYQHALVCLGAGDRAGYRRVCAAMFERFGSREDGDVPRFNAWICSMAPEGLIDGDRLLKQARIGVSNDPASRKAHNTLGAVLYRAGRWAESIEQQDKARKYAEGDGTAWEWFFLAMAHHHLGRAAQARDALEKAVRWEREIHEQKRTNPSAVDWYSWHEEMAFEVLRQETEAVLAGKDP